MLKHGEARVLVVPKVYRSSDHEAIARGPMTSVPSLERVFVIGGGADDFDALLGESGQDVPSLKTFLCAGAPIPGPLVEPARKALGTRMVSS